MFSQACVKNSVRGVRGRGVCGGGRCVCGGGVSGTGHAWRGGEAVWWWGSCMGGETASAADGTHPTGMQSCLKYKLWKIFFFKFEHTGGMLCQFDLFVKNSTNSVK